MGKKNESVSRFTEQTVNSVVKSFYDEHKSVTESESAGVFYLLTSFIIRQHLHEYMSVLGEKIGLMKRGGELSENVHDELRAGSSLERLITAEVRSLLGKSLRAWEIYSVAGEDGFEGLGRAYAAVIYPQVQGETKEGIVKGASLALEGLVIGFEEGLTS